jgi:hypothetical protein
MFPAPPDEDPVPLDNPMLDDDDDIPKDVEPPGCDMNDVGEELGIGCVIIVVADCGLNWVTKLVGVENC